MHCPKCKSDNVVVVDSRPSGATTYRRRYCNNCGVRFSTKEIVEEDLQELEKIRSCLAYLAGQAKRGAENVQL